MFMLQLRGQLSTLLKAFEVGFEAETRAGQEEERAKVAIAIATEHNKKHTSNRFLCSFAHFLCSLHGKKYTRETPNFHEITWHGPHHHHHRH